MTLSTLLYFAALLVAVVACLIGFGAWDDQADNLFGFVSLSLALMLGAVVVDR